MVVSARARRHFGDSTAVIAPEQFRGALWTRDGRPDRPEVVLAAIEQAREAGGPIAAAQALALAHHRLLRPGLGELRHRVAQDLIAEGSRTLRESDTLAGLLWRAVDFILDGDARAARCLTELRGLLAVQDQPTVRFVLRAIEVMFEIRAGRFEQAERRARTCAALGAEVGDVDAAAWHSSHLIAIRWYQGRVVELLPAIRRVAASPLLSPADYSYRTALAVAAAAADHRDEALKALSECGRTLSEMPCSGSWLVALYGVVEAAYLLGERESAAQAYRLLSPYAALPATAGPAISCFGSIEHALGLAQLTLGDPQSAATHLQRAVAHNTALGHHPATTLTRHRLATALACSALPQDRARAEAEADAAQRDAVELGMLLPHMPHMPHGPAFSLALGSSRVSMPARAPSSASAAATTPTAIAPSPASCTAPLTAAPPALSCRRQGRFWEIHAAGRTVLVEHCRGLAYLAVLFANPGTEIPALALTIGPSLAGLDALSVVGACADMEVSCDSATTRPDLDDEALLEYRHRLKELQDEIERCDAVGDQERAIQAHAERDRLLARLRLAVHAPSTADSEERARIAVGKAIRRAQARITAADPQLGALVSATVHTGRRCVYLPLKA